jgi:hypothetical protein
MDFFLLMLYGGRFEPATVFRAERAPNVGSALRVTGLQGLPTPILLGNQKKYLV